MFGHLLENSAVPRAILLCAVFLLLYVVLRVAVLLFDVELLLSAGGSDELGGFGALGVYVNSLAALINETNADAKLTAALFNEATHQMYADQLNVHLINIQSLIDYFNAGNESPFTVSG